MNVLRRHPVFSAMVAVVLFAIGAEAWFVFVLRHQERALEVELGQHVNEIERLQRQRPGPTDENLRRARDDFAQSAEVLATMLRSLNVSGPDELEYFQGEPVGRTEAFFDIAQFVDAMRTNAAKSGVLVRPDERFGFSVYAHEGPEAGLIRPVYRQRRIVEYLLSALFPARPRTLVSVQREDPATIVRDADDSADRPAVPAPRTPQSGAGSATGRATGRAGETAPVSELFTIDPQVSARTPGYVDTMAFRLIFTGQTSALRGFMNTLAMPEIPLVVRSVEVEPLQAETAVRTGRTTADPATQPADLPIVADNESRFIVTVELFEVKLSAPDSPEGRNP